MKDYYEILGIEEEATEEEIRARWIELTKYYQPDLGKSREVDERMKEIDEAYEVLGNKSTRLDYDIKWTLGETVGDKVPAWEAKKFSNKKIILPVGILVFFLMMGILLFRGSDIVTRQKSAPEDEINNILEKKTSPPITSPNAESRVEAGKKAAEEIKEERPQKTEKILSQPFQGPSSVVELESKRKEEYVPKILPKSKGPVRVEEEVLAKEEAKPLKEPVPQVAMKSEVPVGVEKEVPKEVVKEIPKEVPKEVPKEGAGVTLHPGEKLTIRTRGGKEVAKETGKATPRESGQMDKPKPAPPPPFANEEEVMRFFSKYIDRYNQKDLNGFLSFFSSKAVQNQKDGIDGIRNIYTKFFDQSRELRYQVEGMKIEIYYNSVEVNARFRVDQKLKKPREEKIWKGNIRWVLVKEDGNLKISSLDYRNEKSP